MKIHKEKTMAIQEKKVLVKKLFEGINLRDLEVLDKLLNTNFVWHGNNNQGKAEYQKDLEAVIAAFPDAKWVIEEILGEEDKIVVRWSTKQRLGRSTRNG